MPDEKDSQFGFRVIDKRSLREDGTRRDDARPEEAKTERPAETSRDRTAPAEPELEEAFEQAPASFEMLVSYLSTTAMFQLGLIPGPAGERIPTDLINAQRTIDLLDVLREKTRGNLTRDEAKLLDDILYELRLSYVEINKRLAQKRK